MLKFSLRCVLFAFLAAAPAAHAVPVTYLLTGQLPGHQQLWSGESWVAYLTIDDTPISDTFGEARYVADGGGFGLVLALPRLGITAVADSVRLTVGNDASSSWGPFDYMHLRASGGTLGLDDHFNFDMLWADVVGPGNESPIDAINSNALFPSPLAFSHYCHLLPVCQMQIGTSQNAGGYSGMDDLTVTRLPIVIPVQRVVAVQEAGSLALLCLGIVLVVISRWRGMPSMKFFGTSLWLRPIDATAKHP